MPVSAAMNTELPGWAEEIAGHYFSRTQSTFILHGNVRDLVRVQHRAGHKQAEISGDTEFVPLDEYLWRVLFAKRKFVIKYDLSHGLALADPTVTTEFERILRAIAAVTGSNFLGNIPADPHGILRFLSRFFRSVRAQKHPDARRIAVIFDYAEMIFPRAEITNLSQADRAAEIALERLASSPEVVDDDITLVLIVEDIAAVSTRIVESQYTAEIKIPIPDEKDRRDFIDWYAKSGGASSLSLLGEVEPLSSVSAGLNLTQIRNVLAEIDAGTVSKQREAASWRTHLLDRKRKIIERDCGGMLEFIGGSRDALDLVAVHKLAVAELKADAALLQSGETRAVPSGYLICGPSGCGKSFLIRCFAGEAGVPCVELRNFRDKWVGATEANLEKLLSVLSALAPVIVIVDEADAALGDRGSSEGDSGLSGRVFSRLISFMGDPRNRGRVVWVLITNRPDRLSIDLKRQGRAEKHIPLFAPETVEDYEDLFGAFTRKHDFRYGFNRLSDSCDASRLSMSGSDFESVLFRAYAQARRRKEDVISADDLKNALADFTSPEYPDEVEYQTLLGVAESTSRALIPDKWRIEPAAMAERIAKLRLRLPRG